MKLRLPKMLTAALLAAFAVPSAYAGAIDQNSTLNKDDNITYNGKIYTMSGSGNFSKRTFTEYIAVGDHMEEGTATTPWQSFANNQSQTYGHTLRMKGIDSNQSVNTDFSPFSLGGLIVEAGAGTYTLSRTGTATDFNGVGDVNLNIKGSLTLLSNNAPGIKFFKGGDWIVASGKTLTFETTQAVVLDNGIAVDITGGGKVKVAGNLITNAGATIAIASGTTLEVTGTATLGAAITNNGALTFGVGTAVVSDFSAFRGDVEYTDGNNGFVSKGTYKLIEGEGTVTGLSKVSYGGTTFNVDETDHTVTMSDYTTYHLYTQGAGVVVDVAAETARAQGATLTTVDVKNSGATITVNSAQQLVNLTVAAGAGATINGSGTMTVTGTLTCDGLLDIASGVTLKVDNASQAKALMLSNGKVANNGTVVIGDNVTLDSSATTTMTGTLAVAAGKKLTIGTNKDNQSYNLTSLDALVLGQGANIDTKALKVDIKNLTANGSTIKMLDTKDKNQVGVDLKGTTTLDGDLTITSDWKYKVNIEKLAGEGNLILTGGWEEHRAVIGDADINSISVKSAMTETWLNGTVKLSGTLDLNGGTTYAGENGSLTVGGLTGSAALNVANGITFNVAEGGDYSYTGTLTVGGQVVKKGLGSQSIGAYEMHKAMDVQAGTLVLNGAYSIDNIALDADSTVTFYNNEGGESTSGFRKVSGAKTVYTVADGAVVDTTTGGASFTEGGETVALSNGKYLIGGTTDYTTLWVNGGTLSYDAYYTASQEALTTAKVADGATLEVGEHAVGTLTYQTNGTTIGLAGTGTVDAISGTGILNMAADAHVAVPSLTVSSAKGVYSTGTGTLALDAVTISGSGSIEFDSSTEIGTTHLTGGSITFGGTSTTHTLTDLGLSQEGGSASTVNVKAGTTVHIVGTTVAKDRDSRFMGSFSLSHWSADNTVNVYGTLISDVVVSSCDGRGIINVESGGRLEMRDGLNRGNYNDNAITFNVKSGATLAAGTTHNTTETKNSNNVVVNLEGGSTFEAYYGEVYDTAEINKVLTFGEGVITMNAGAAGKTLQLNSNIAGEGVTIAKTGAGALALNGDANVLYNAINVQAGTLALNGTFDLSHITHEQGTVKYFKDDQPGTVESDNGFAKYVGEVQLVNGLTENVTQGASATLTLDGYNVTYDAATGKAVSSDISLGTYYINTGSETLSEIQQVSPTAGVSMKGGTTLVADADFSGSLTVTGDGSGKLAISKDKLVSATAPNQALELSGEGTYALAAGSINKGRVTLGEDWDGYLRITNFTPGNAQELTELGSALELNGFKGWDKNHWSGTMAMDIKLTDYVEGETTKVAWSCGSFSTYTPMPICTFTGAWSGTGTFKEECAAGKYMGYEYQGNIADWTGAFITTCQTVLTFSEAATDVNIAISKDSGTLDLVVNNAATFTNSVAVDSTTISTSATFKNTANLGSLSGAGALTVDAGGNTVTVNGISGLANTITLTSGTLSLNGTVDISNDMPVTGGSVYYIGGQDTNNGFKTVQGKLQIVDISEGAHLIEGEGISYRLGGEEIATQLDNGSITVEPTTTYGTFYVNKAGTTESITNAIRVATEASSTLTAVVMSADTTLAADAEATYSLALDADASAKVDVTAATTISSLTGPVAGKTLTVTGSNAITIQSASDFEGNVSITGSTVKLGFKTALGKYNTDTAKVITIGAGGTVDTNGQADANYNYVLAGGTLTNTGAGKDVNSSQTTGLTLTADSYIGSEGQNEMWVARRTHAANTIELGGFTLTKNGAGLFGFKNSAITAGTLQVNAGTVKLEGSSIAANVVLNGGALTGTLTPSADINVTAQQSVTIGSDLAFSIAEGKTVTLKTAEEQAITFSSAFTHANGKLVAAGTVNFNQGLTPNSGTVEVSGTVNVSGKSLDLSNASSSTGKLNVTGTGVLNVNNGMWMNTNAIDIAEGGTMNIAGLHIVGEADGATIATSVANQSYGTDNDKYVITNAAVTGTTNINLGNKLVDSTLTTGAYTMTLKNAESSYDAVYVSTGGTLVIDADINLAGVLQSSGAITVNAEKSLTLTEGSSLFQTVTNGGEVILTGITLGGGFSEETEGSAYYDINGNATTEDQNHYEGTATTYVQVVDGGTSSGTGIRWNDESYALDGAGRIIVGQGGADYGTFYVVNGSVNISDITGASHGTSAIQVSNNGILVVDEQTQDISIDVTGTGTISGQAVNPTQVGIAAQAEATFEQGIDDTENGVQFSSDEGGVIVKNTNGEYGGADIHYSIGEASAQVTADKLTFTGEVDTAVANQVVVDEIVNETHYQLTLENAANLELKSMTIGEGSKVAVYTDETAVVEGTVTITESLVAGGGTLLANLVLTDRSTLDLSGAGENALTLGSNLAFVDGAIVNLDADTLDELDKLAMGGFLALINAEQGTHLTYGGNYNDMWFGQLFDRTAGEYTLKGDFKVVATDETFGLTKVSKVPEPTTGTLSLLALAALAARRRRH